MSAHLEQLASPIRAEMNYLGQQKEKPLFHTRDPNQSRMELEKHIVSIQDARQLKSASLDREGFQLVRQPLPQVDYHNPVERDGTYLVGLQEFIRASLGASRVVTDTSILRLPDPDAFQVPVLTVHSDYTPSSARRLLEESWNQEKSRKEGLAETAELISQSLDASPSDRRFRRVIALNAWRPISKPPHDVPLAVCDRTTMSSGDIRVADFIEELPDDDPYQGELSLCHFNERHAWYCYSDMQPDEVLLFLGLDFSDPARCGVMHSAFRDPTCPTGAPGRASVEVRAFAFFEA
jgi:hypothetical protein